jgi:hypothetical protein
MVAGVVVVVIVMMVMVMVVMWTFRVALSHK